MAIDILSTLSTFQKTLSDMGKVQNDLAKEQIQISSGIKSPDFAGMSSDTQQYLALDATIGRLTQYQNDNQVVLSRINTTSTALGQVIDTASALQKLILQRRSGSFDATSFGAQLNGIWQQLAGQLNTNVGGKYLFSGTKTDTPPMNADLFPILDQIGHPDDNYYHGSQQDITVRADDDVLLTANARADDTGIQKIVAALATAKRGNDQGTDDYLAQAIALIDQGIRDTVSSRATVDANKVALTNVVKNQQSLQLYWQGLRESIGNTDVVAVSTQVAVNQGILQATFQAFAKITSLQLSNYLK